jgi:hypothetical protein
MINSRKQYNIFRLFCLGFMFLIFFFCIFFSAYLFYNLSEIQTLKFQIIICILGVGLIGCAIYALVLIVKAIKLFCKERG